MIRQSLKAASREERVLLRYVNQLAVLSNIRNLEEETITQTQAIMTGHIEDFKLYQMGQKEGREDGKEKEKKENITAFLESRLLTPE